MVVVLRDFALYADAHGLSRAVVADCREKAGCAVLLLRYACEGDENDVALQEVAVRQDSLEKLELEGGLERLDGAVRVVGENRGGVVGDGDDHREVGLLLCTQDANDVSRAGVDPARMRLENGLLADVREDFGFGGDADQVDGHVDDHRGDEVGPRRILKALGMGDDDCRETKFAELGRMRLKLFEERLRHVNDGNLVREVALGADVLLVDEEERAADAFRRRHDRLGVIGLEGPDVNRRASAVGAEGERPVAALGERIGNVDALRDDF